MAFRDEVKLAGAFRRNSLLVVALLAAETIIAMSPLMSQGWFTSHESLCQLERLFAVSHEMRSGDYYPRWLSTAYFGKGLPLLNFYSPAYYLVAGWLHVAGIPLVTALKVITFVIFFAGAWGMYLWVRENCNESGAVVAATVYMFLPYHFLGLYVRGAYSEFMALALLPYLFHGIDLSLRTGRELRGVLLVALTSAAIVLTHNLSALMAAPFALAMFTWRAHIGKVSLRQKLGAAAGPTLGAGLSAFYWLPVLAETQYLDRFKAVLTGGYYSYDVHFVYPFQWFTSAWGFGPSVPGPNDGMSFNIGVALLAALAVAAVEMRSAMDRGKNFGYVTLGLGLLGLFLTTSLSSIFYDIVAPFQYVQFPWRFLGVATLFFAAFTGLSTSGALARRTSLAPGIIVTAVLALCLFSSANQRKAHQNGEYDIYRMEEIKIENKDIGLLASRNEFRPRWVPSYYTEPGRDPIIVRDTSTTQVTNLSTEGTSLSFRVAKADSNPMTIYWFYFPGWQAEVDGVRVPVTPTRRGFISFDVPAGAHKVRLWFGSTWPRMLGWLIACVTTFVIGVKALLLRRGRFSTPLSSNLSEAGAGEDR